MYWGVTQTGLLLFTGYIIFAILWGCIKGYGATFADLNQLIRMIKYISIYTFAVTVFKNSPDKITDDILNLVIISSVILALIIFQQRFNIYGLNEHYVKFIAPTQYETLINNYKYPRPVGMIGNPNEAGFLLVMSILVTAYRLLTTQKRDLKFSLFLFIQLAALLSTLSRSALISMFGGLFILLIGLNSTKTSLRKMILKKSLIIVFLIMLATSSVFLVPSLYHNIGWRFARIANLSEETSFQARLSNWQENIEIINSENNSLFGVGPLRRVKFQHAADNEWLLLVRSYGIIGTILLCLTLLIPLIFSSPKNILTEQKRLRKSLVLALLVSSSLYMIPASVFHALTLMPLLLLILTIKDNSGKIYTILF